MTENLWNDFTQGDEYYSNKQLYQNHILEQYKIYVEMADRISVRRNLTNVFFLTLNNILLAIIGFIYDKIVLIQPKWIVIFPFASILLICVIWWWLIKSYRNLNTAKYKVIGHLEQKLPSSPYWVAEWKELGEGKSIKKYLPLTALEKFVPLIFGILYITMGIYFIMH